MVSIPSDRPQCSCSYWLQPDWKFCPRCGGKIEQTIKVWYCSKCQTAFEHDGTDHPHGILCPECRHRGYELVGVLQEMTISKYTPDEVEDGDGQVRD